LHASYAKRCLPLIEERLRMKRLKIVGFFDAVRVLEIPEAMVRRIADPAVVFMNVNTPDELAYARALEAQRERGGA
jgi:molybdopterin-guanine dinucleotide biosynthesis protein A